jgi:hypothetical protein
MESKVGDPKISNNPTIGPFSSSFCFLEILATASSQGLNSLQSFVDKG